MRCPICEEEVFGGAPCPICGATPRSGSRILAMGACAFLALLCVAGAVGVRLASLDTLKRSEQGGPSAGFPIATAPPERDEERLRVTFRASLERAEEGEVAAMVQVGIALENGEGVEADHEQAFAWYTRAARSNSALGMSRLAWAYNIGIGTPIDDAKFRSWNGRAVRARDPFATARAYAYGLVPGGRGFVDAYPHYLKAAQAGDLRGHYFVAKYLELGRGVKKDPVAGTEWYLRGAVLGNSACMQQYGEAAEDGRGVQENIVVAREWYRRSAARKHPHGLISLGLLYKKGKGIPRDFENAVALFRRSADSGRRGSDFSMYELGLAYARGHGVPQDQARAAEWYRQAARRGHKLAMLALGDRYETGRGVEKNDALAARWYRAAAAAGSRQGKARLQRLLIRRPELRD